MTPDGRREARITHIMLAFCLLGIGWLIVATERLEAGTRSALLLTRPPLVTRWTDNEGMQQELLIYPLPGESEAALYERQRGAVAKARVYFPPLVEPFR